MENRPARGIEAQEQWGCDAWRHLLQHGLRHAVDLRQRGVDIHGWLKKDLDDPVIGDRLGFNMLDVVDAVGQRSLIKRDDPAGHVVGGQAGEAETHADDRNGYFWKYDGSPALDCPRSQ